METAPALAAQGITVPINATGATVTIRAATSGRRWALHYLYLESDSNTTVLFNSGSTAISGALTVAATTAGTPAPLVLDGGGSPVLMTRSVGDALTVTNGTSSANLDGFALLIGYDTQ